MDLSIVIVNYRAWDDLARCLDSLAALPAAPALEAEVVVVDNASGDDRLADFERRYPWVEFVAAGDNFGYAHGCNLGAAAARGRELLFLNPDCRDPGGQIERLYAVKTAGPDIAILAPRQLHPDGRPQKVGDRFPSLLTLFGPFRALARLLAPRRFPDTRRLGSGTHRIDWVSGAALMIAADCLTEIGGWCDAFWLYSEDVDLCRRAADRNLPVAVTGDASLIHRHGGASRATPALAALTRSEALISKHLYARRHLPVWHRWPYQALLIAARYLPRALAAALAPVIPLPRLRIEAGAFFELSRFYRGAIRNRHWISPRSIRYPTRRQTDNP